MTTTTARTSNQTRVPVMEIGETPKLIIDCDTPPSVPTGLRAVERHYLQGKIPWDPRYFHLFQTREQRGVNDTPTTKGLRTVGPHRMMAAMSAKGQMSVNAGVFCFIKQNPEVKRQITDLAGDQVTSISFLATLFEGPCNSTHVARLSLIKGVWHPDHKDLTESWGPGDAVLVFSRLALDTLDIPIPD